MLVSSIPQSKQEHCKNRFSRKSKKQIRNNFQQKRGQKQIFHLKIKSGKKPEFPFLLPCPKVNCEKTLSSCLKTVYHFF